MSRDPVEERHEDFLRAVKLMKKLFDVVAVYSPDDQILAMHWAVDQESLNASAAETIQKVAKQ